MSSQISSGCVGAGTMQQGEGSLDDPAVLAKPGAVFGVTACDDRRDTNRLDLPAVLAVVVGAIGEHRVRSSWVVDYASADVVRVVNHVSVQVHDLQAAPLTERGVAKAFVRLDVLPVTGDDDDDGIGALVYGLL